jgi:hypothetical protein
MQIYTGTASRREPRSAHRRWRYAAIVASDAVAILVFNAWVVIPKLI